MPDLDALIAAKDYLSNDYLKAGPRPFSWFDSILDNRVDSLIENARNNVHAVGIGKKIIGGIVTPIPAICIYVIKKIHPSLLPKDSIFPPSIGDIPTDVIQAQPAFLITEPICTSDRRLRQRPIGGGISIGSGIILLGTLGYFCKSTKPGDDPSKKYILSNNHVLADIDRVKLGYEIYQPGPDGGFSIDNIVARFQRSVKLKQGDQHVNNVDAAIAEILTEMPIVESICKIGKVEGTIQAEIDMSVCKHGAWSGYSKGLVTHQLIDTIITIKYEEPNPHVAIKFINQIRIEGTNNYPRFALSGDSGSLVVNTETNQAVGLLFAAPTDGSYAYANHIETVESELEIKLL